MEDIVLVLNRGKVVALAKDHGKASANTMESAARTATPSTTMLYVHDRVA
jgi:hypothetical protein